MGTSAPHILIVVQNLPVPLDRRVWLECRALTAAGYEVSVICPKGPGDPSFAVLDGVHLYKYRPPPPADGLAGYAAEFVYCWVRTAGLLLRVWRRRPVDVLQACNPPDTYWALAALLRIGARRTQFVFDHHDLNPEVFLSRFGSPTTLSGRLQLAGLRWLERRTFRTADHVISTNESYRRIAIERGGVDPAATTVVRSGPDTTRMRPVQPDTALRRGRRHMLVYLGIMGPQDGVDIVLRTLAVLVHERGQDIHAALLGFGDCYEELVALAAELGVSDHVTFTGRADLKLITEYLSAADIGIGPDPLSPLNDVSTMNKTMEYMAYALPVVSYDLAETRVSGGDAVAYVDPSGSQGESVQRFADAVVELIDDPARRDAMAAAGRRRAERVLDWFPQLVAYVSAYDALTGHRSPTIQRPGAPTDGLDEWGHVLVDLDSGEGLASARLPHAIEVRR